MNLPPVKESIESLESNDVKYELYDKVRIEPTDTRYTSANSRPCVYLIYVLSFLFVGLCLNYLHTPISLTLIQFSE